MSLKERVYSVLVVSAAEKLNTALLSLLPEARFSPVRVVTSVSAARRLLGERDFDFVIVNSPLPDDVGTRFAVDAGTSAGTVALMLIRAEIHDEVQDKVAEHGVFTLPKPVTKTVMLLALDWMSSTRERLRRLEKKTLSVEEKMEEIRVVNRAKWVLISELKMEEPQAHRYIEKQAMDRCVPRRVVAEEVIRTYTSR
ncbi:MAG: ANTAR domain-containing protein [Oscillospiraceae bacterium]|nr:ANTAR domain-containing protein [Oscillospiraceae bacterium]